MPKCGIKLNLSREFFLSKSGKEILIKSVLQAIPTYVMSCFKLPNYLLHELESVISNYYWGNEGGDKMHWINWQLMCKSKRDGGLVLGTCGLLIWLFLGNKSGVLLKILILY